jgi:hypothetical protein
MAEVPLFVSCDIVGHSSEPDIDLQLQRVAGINGVVRAAMETAPAGQMFWFSGGDGGHVALMDAVAPDAAIDLILTMKAWSESSGVPLRVTGSTGPVLRFQGADGRTDMIGPGLTLAARVLSVNGGTDRVVVSDGFRQRYAAAARVRFHDPRVLDAPGVQREQVWLLSVPGKFESNWGDGSRDALTALYEAKRKLQIQPTDRSALNVIRQMAGGGGLAASTKGLLRELSGDPKRWQGFVQAASLVERHGGETLFQAGEPGVVMFMLLRGLLHGYLPSNERQDQFDFQIEPGTLFGEMAVVLRTERNATLRCSGDCALLAFGHENLNSAGEGIKHELHAIVLGRIVQNVCLSSQYLSGRSRTGPFGHVERPWIDLASHSRLIQVDWREAATLKSDAAILSAPGLYFLVSGRLTGRDGIKLAAEPEPPLVAAEVGDLKVRSGEWTLEDNITLLFIDNEGLSQFDRASYLALVDAIRARVSTPAVPMQRRSVVEGLTLVGGPSRSAPLMDVVFVHGLDGDSRTTWQVSGQPGKFWPQWLVDDLPGVNVWSFGYNVSSSAWRGTTMPLVDRASHALATLEAQGIGARPTAFIAHSFGGLVVKQMLRNGMDLSQSGWRAIAQATRGIVFLSTPQYGSDMATWLKYVGTVLRLTKTVEELEASDPQLRNLNAWFRASPLVSMMSVAAYCETQPFHGVRVVNEVSADPGLAGVEVIPVEEDHSSICKPGNREKLVYARVKLFLDRCLAVVQSGV